MANENIQELKFQVGEAWKGVYSSSTAYGLANVVQDHTGLSIYRSLKSGNVGHPLSDNAWWFCIIDMSSIKAESDRIAALNQAIAEDEALRKAAEELRQQHEAERVAAETQRNEAEQARISAEQNRVNAESARATAEQQRITAEQGRVSAESARVQAEQARVLAETLRANAEDQRAANEQNRVAAEQQRIERAEQDHQRAESDHATYVDSLGAFDISSYHATDGVLAKYADLTAALGTNGANIPDDLRKGGMSVKFVQSSDNKYVQFRYMLEYANTTAGNAAFVNEANWQGVDEEPTAGSSNLVESGGVEKNLKEIKDSILGSYTCDTGANIAIKVITEQVTLLQNSRFLLTFNRGVNVFDNVRLKVNGQDDIDAKPLYYNGSPVSSTNFWERYDVVEVYYDGNIYYAKPYITSYDKEPVKNSKHLAFSGGIFSQIENKYLLANALTNNNKLKLEGIFSMQISSYETEVYITVPLALDADSYVVSMGTTGGTANVALFDENKNNIKGYSASFPYRFTLNEFNSILYIRVEFGATATSIDFSFKKVASEYSPIQYLTEGLYTVNNADPTNPKWSNNLSTKHYTIPVTAGDTIRGKGNTSTVVAFFVASQITTPTGGATIPQISQFNFPKRVEASTTVPASATYAILDGMPAYLYVNGVNVVNDVIQALINRVSGGDGFAFQGVTTPSTSISTPESKAFYLGADGTYTNFGSSLTVPVGSIGIFTYNSGSWSLSTIAVKQPLDIPNGWQPYVDNAISYVQANNLLSGQNGDSFVFVTDSHYPNNWGNSVKIAAAVSKKTNNRVFIHGGDFITKNQTRATFFGVLRDYTYQLKSLYGTAWRILFGNHDDNTQDSGGSESELVTDNEFYAVAMKGFENEVVNLNRDLYYYWDNVNQNIRYVCFNFGTGGAVDAQLSWFDSIVRNAPTNAHICIIIHGMYGSGSDDFMTQEGHLADMCDAINTRGIYTLGGATYDYSNITTKVSVILCGHIHQFKQVYYGTSQIPVVCLEGDAYTGESVTYSQKVHFIDLDFTNAKMHIFTLGYNINDSKGRDNKTPITIVV